MSILLSSCSTIFHSETKDVDISIDSKIKDFSIIDSIHYKKEYNESGTYEVKRSGEPLFLRVRIDTATEIVKIEPHTSLTYYLNILNYGFGYFYEFDIPKKYSFPDKITLEIKDNILKVSKSSASDAGTINLSISMPYVNTFYLQKTGKKDVTTGFLGIGAGLEVFYKDKNYLAASTATGIDFPYFFPFHVDVSGTYETENSITRYVSLRNHNQFGIFDFGYGIHYSMLYWQKSYFYNAGIPASPDKVEIFESTNAGLSLAAHIFTSEYFKVGFLYQPSIYQVMPEKKFKYQHFGSLEFIWRIPILKL